MSARMEKVREALDYALNDRLSGEQYDAALAEVEEWEAEVQRLGDDVAEQALRIIDLGQKENEAVARAEAAEAKNAELSKLIVEQEADYRERKKAAEAEADRLKAALRWYDENDSELPVSVTVGKPGEPRKVRMGEIARAALAPADRDTGEET